MLPDLSTAEVVDSGGPDLTSAVPADAEYRAIARDKAVSFLQEAEQGKHPDLTEEQLLPIVKAASVDPTTGQQTTPSQRLWKNVKNVAGIGLDSAKTVSTLGLADTETKKIAGNLIGQAAEGTKHLFQEATEAEKKSREKPFWQQALSTLPLVDIFTNQFTKDATVVGAGKTASFIGDTANSALTGLANLGDEVKGGQKGYDPDLENARAILRNGRMNAGIEDIEKSVGANPESTAGEAGALAMQALIPVGIEAKGAKAIAETAQGTVRGAEKAIGLGLEKGAQVGQNKVVQAGGLLATGHPAAAAGVLAADYFPVIGKYLHNWRTQIMDATLGKVENAGEILRGAPKAGTITDGLIQEAQSVLDKNAVRLENIKARENIADDAYVFGRHADGTFIEPNDSKLLSGPEKEIRQIQIENLNQESKINQLKGINDYNKVFDYVSAAGLATAGNAALGGAIGGALGGINAVPGDEEAAKNTAVMMGLFSAPFAPFHAVKGLREVRAEAGRDAFSEMGKGLTTGEAYESLSPDVQKEIDVANGMLRSMGGDRIEILPKDEFLKAEQSSLSETDPNKSPSRGFVKNGTIYLNASELGSGVIGHELTHFLPQAIGKMAIDILPDLKARLEGKETSHAYKDFEEYYNSVSPDPSVTKVPDEVLAEAGRRVLLDMPPELFYGGESGADVLKRWGGRILKKIAPDWYNKNNIDPVLKAPISKADEAAVRKHFFDVGERASRPDQEKLSDVTLAPKEDKPAPYPEEVTTAAQALEALGHNKKKAQKMAEAAHDDIKAGTVEEIVRKALEKQKPIPVDSSGALSDVSLMPSSSTDTLQSPAIQLEDGMIIRGFTHDLAIKEADRLGLETKGAVTGFTTKKGNFLAQDSKAGKQDALNWGIEIKQFPETLDRLTDHIFNATRLTPHEKSFMPSQETGEEAQEGPADAPKSPLSSRPLLAVSLHPEKQNASAEATGPFKGKTIEVGEEPWSIRLKELADKQWNDKLTSKEEDEILSLHKQAEREYGSYANWWEKSGAEKDYEAKVFGEGRQKDARSREREQGPDREQSFMPSAPEEYKELQDKYGLAYNGPMESLHIFTDPKTHSSIAVKAGVSPEQFEKKILDSKAKFAAGEDKISMMPSPNKLGFYSKLESVLEDKMPNRASVEQIRGLIKSQGVKPDEIKWSGLDDYLKEQEKLGLPITKKEVLDYVKANNVQVREVVLSEGETKFDQYVTPGRESGSYRELLLTLPPKNIELPPNTKIVEAGKGMYEIREESSNKLRSPRVFSSEREAMDWISNESNLAERVNFQSSHYDQLNILAHVRFDTRITPQGKDLHIAEIQSDWASKGRKEGFGVKGDEFSIKEYGDAGQWGVYDSAGNIFDGPLKTREEAERMAAQRNSEGRMAGVLDAPFVKSPSGYSALALKRMIRYAAENGFDSISWDGGEVQAARYDLSKHIDDIVYGKTRDGEYNISARKDGESVISKIVPEKELEATVGKDVAQKIINGSGEEYNRDVRSMDYPGGLKKLSGLDLKVGGEGMKGFYDKILPSVAKDIGKKFGTKVETLKLNAPSDKYEVEEYAGGYYVVEKSDARFDPDGDHYEYMSYGKQGEVEAQNYADNLNSKEPQEIAVHSMKITPQMRESVMKEGFPQFMPSGNKETKLSQVSLAPKTYETPLTDSEEKKFLKWKAKYAPKDSGEDYDFRGAFKAGVKPDKNGHWPDTFKKPNHPTFSNGSMYAKDRPDLAGKWKGNKFIPPRK